MGLFKNNYMFSKVTNYSFILNERKTTTTTKNPLAHTYTCACLPACLSAQVNSVCTSYAGFGFVCDKENYDRVGNNEMNIHIDSQKLARSRIYKHNLN